MVKYILLIDCNDSVELETIEIENNPNTGDIIKDNIIIIEDINSRFDFKPNIKIIKNSKNNLNNIIEEDDKVFVSIFENSHLILEEENKVIIRYLDGGLYNGEIIDGNPNGECTWEFLNGDKYKGSVKNGKYHGNGTFETLNFTFKGIFCEDKPVGFGRLYLKERCLTGIFSGDFFNLKFGKMIFNNGDLYEGEFLNLKLHGNGTLKYRNGNVYTGEWINNKREGKGKIIHFNGDIYEGDFSNDYKNGFGLLIKNNIKYYSEFINNEPKYLIPIKN